VPARDAVGGQAVLEGVMMRSATRVATAVKRPDGTIAVTARPYVSYTKRRRVLGLPLVRGAVVLIESLALGMQALSFSAEESLHGENEARSERKSAGERWAVGGVMALSFVLGIGLFFYVPLVLTELLGVKGGVLFNVVDGVFRIAILVAYLFVLTRFKDMRRVFQYHGAEHKSIHAFEAGDPLEPASAQRFSTCHPRCGTNFLFLVMFTAIIVFLFLGRPESVPERLARFLMVPVIGGLSYELLRLAGRRPDQPLVRLIALPGMWLQRLTTREPDDEQVAVALRALREVL
jgi:uncharacterized protein YqhQ